MVASFFYFHIKQQFSILYFLLFYCIFVKRIYGYFTKFKILLKQIFNRKISYTYKRLIRNIKTGDIIEVNGKKYRKIKITFVDSMSYTVSNHLDNLENEIHVLNEQLTEVHTEIEKLNEQKIALQNYNNKPYFKKNYAHIAKATESLRKLKRKTNF